MWCQYNFPQSGRSGAWDPTVSNTPAHSRDFDDYSYDDTTPSPNYNPATPGGSATEGSGRYESPSGAPFTPTTPGSIYNAQDVYSPYQATGASPYGLTPSPAGQYQTTPSPNYAVTSPGYSPMTPGAHSPYTPATPGLGSHLDALGTSVIQKLTLR